MERRETYANVFFSFASRASLGTLNSGEHYRDVSHFLVHNITRPSLENTTSTPRNGDPTPSFIAVHTFPNTGMHY
jgi:hypothetical protein